MMGKTPQRLILIARLLLYLSEVALHIYVAIQYWKNNDVWWFSITTVFILVFILVLQLSLVISFSEAIHSPGTHTFSPAKLCYLQTITESAPQLCLQAYIMLCQWKFPRYTAVSCVLSLLSLVWNTTALEKEVTLVVFFWQRFTLVSRLSAIVIFAYVFHYYVIVFLAAHWFILTMTMCGIELFSDRSDGLNSLVLSLLAAYPSLFFSSKPVFLTRRPKLEMILVYISLLVENIIIVTWSLTEMPDTPHMNELKIFAIPIFTVATTLSFICFIFCYRCMDFTSSTPEIIRTTQMAMREYGQRNDAHDITEQYDTYF